MSVAGSIDVPVEIIGGLVCDMASGELPPGVSPDCQDMRFTESSARTRDGLTTQFTVAGNPTINYLKTFITGNGTLRMLQLDSLGNLWKESTPGNLSLVQALNDVNVAPYANSTSLFGREYMAIGDGKFGLGLPRQFDDTNFDRVSQDGPGSGPVVTAFLPAAASIAGPAGSAGVNIVASPSGIVWGGFVQLNPYYPQYGPNAPGYTFVTVSTTAPHGAHAGDVITIAGATEFNGNWTVATVPNANAFTINQTAAQSSAVNGGNGTVKGPAQLTNSIVRQNNVATVFTSAAHGFQIGLTVSISGIAAVAVGGGISTISQQAGLVTCTTASAHGLVAGCSVVITGTTNYNGTYTVIGSPNATQFTFQIITTPAAEAAGTVSSPLVGTYQITGVPTTTSFTYANLGPNISTTATGTATIIGNVSAGPHSCAVIFVTRTQFFTRPCQPVSFIADGGKLLSITGIPIGPPNVISRILIFTSSGGANYYYISGTVTTGTTTVIADNTTTSAIVDFQDAVLLAGVNADALFNQVELGECSGVIDYSQRTLWWGERSKIQNFVNLGFDGGFSTPGGLPNYPLGWTPDPTFAPGGASALAQGATAVWGDAYMIVGNGATATRGKMTQGAALDWRGVQILAQNVSYSVRARVAKNNLLAQGALHINITSASGAFTTTGLVLTPGQVTQSYVEYSAVILAPQLTLPTDLMLQIYADGTPNQNGAFLVDCVEIYQTLQPVNTSVIRASKASNPEAFDGVTGLLQVAQNDGYSVRSAFKMRERIYFVKEHALYASQDDGQNEPALWNVSEISRTVGTPSVRGVAVGEDWAVIADRAGLYITSGGEPKKISQEIGKSDKNFTLAWNQINWQYAHTLWVTVDTQERRILIGAPFGTATSPNAILQLDYRDIQGGADAIEGSPPIRTSFQGKKIVSDKSRKWSPWTISANSCALIERPDGSAQLFLGSGNYGNQLNQGKTYMLDPAALTDDGVAIPSYYVTSYIPQREHQVAMQIHAHRILFTYLTMFIEGAGTIHLTALIDGPSFGQPLADLRMRDPMDRDLELGVNVMGERVAFKMSADLGTPGNWFRLQKFTPNLLPDPWAPVRGQN